MPPRGYRTIEVREEIYNEFVDVCKEMNATSQSDCIQKLILFYYKFRSK